MRIGRGRAPAGRALVVHAHPSPESYSAELCRRVVSGLTAGGWTVDVLDLYEMGFQAAMSAEERLGYEEIGANVFDPDVARSIELVRAATAMVFVYPSWWFGPPAIMKGWMERVMLPGVSFVLDEHRKVQPRLTHVRHLVGVSTYGSPRSVVFGMNDAGRRLILRTLRVNMGLRVRRRWFGLYAVDNSSAAERAAFAARVESAMAAL